MTTMTPQQYATLMTVIGGLEQAISGLREVLGGDDQESVHVPGQGEWTEAEVRQIWRLTEQLPRARSLLAVTASAAQQTRDPITFSDVVAQTRNPDAKQQRVEHAALSRVTRSFFGEKRWPLEAWQHHDGEARYRMPTGIAEWVLSIMEEGS